MVPVKASHVKVDCDVLLVLSFLAGYISTYIAVDDIHLVIMFLTI